MTALIVVDLDREFQHDITGDQIRVSIPAGTELAVWTTVDVFGMGECVQVLWEGEPVNLPMSECPSLWRLVR